MVVILKSKQEIQKLTLGRLSYPSRSVVCKDRSEVLPCGGLSEVYSCQLHPALWYLPNRCGCPIILRF
jgi:hypothetical protein